MSPDELRSYCSTFSHVQDSEMLSQDSRVIGWHSSLVDQSGRAIGSGCSTDKNTARRIAVAETLERLTFQKLARDPLASHKFDLRNFDNSDGFAAGFERQSTMFRSIFEAVERWMWSKWIDNQFFIPKVDPPEQTELALSFLKKFDRVDYYRIEIPLVIQNTAFRLFGGITLAYKGTGVFPGSRVSNELNSVWEHGAVESIRNLIIFQNDSGNNDLITKRIKFFGRNADLADRQIPSQADSNWPAPQLRLLEEYQNPKKDFFLWRSLCSNYQDWHSGPLERFVY